MRAEHQKQYATLNPRIHTCAGDRPFADLLRLQGPCSEEALAAIIEVDGRARLERGLQASLDTYLGAIPTLDQMTVALDSAIDMALRSLAGDSAPTELTVEALVRLYPALEPAIREAAMLGHALHTSAPAPRRAASRYAGRLPCDFGPVLPDGRSQYVFQKLLGRGAFGEVYLAQDRLLSDDDRPALTAIKVLADDPDHAEMRYRLADEATKARRVDHPNVVRVIARARAESGEDFVVYEYVEGPNLQEHVRLLPSRMAARDAVQLVIRLARGVHAAHAAGLVHRDLKPGNVLMDADLQPRITDFGVAIRDRGDAESHSEDQRAGTLAFMAPEQFTSRLGAVGPPADIFAIAGMLVWLLLGRPPYGATPEELTTSHIHAAKGLIPAPLRTALESLPPTLAHVLRHALSTDPELRHSSAAELADELTCWLERRPVPSMNLNPWRRASLWAQRRPGLAAVSTLAVLSLLVGGAAALHQRDLALRRTADAQIAAAKVEAEEQRRAMVASTFAPFSADMIKGAESDPMAALGTVLLWIEAFQQGNYQDRSDLKAVYETRVQLAVDRIAAAESEPGYPFLETMYWLVAVTQWTIEDGEWDRPLQWVNQARAAISERWPGDPWLRILDALENAARANQILAAPSFNQDAASLIAQRLESDVKELDVRTMVPARDLAASLLDRLNAPKALNRPKPPSAPKPADAQPSSVTPPPAH